MALWNRLRQELDRAGRVAQSAFDEGRLRLDVVRARQTADRFAQRLGYALYHARRDGLDLSPEEYAAHANNLAAAEAEVARYQTLVDEVSKKRKQPDLPKTS
jgi:hypothetical protein